MARIRLQSLWILLQIVGQLPLSAAVGTAFVSPSSRENKLPARATNYHAHPHEIDIPIIYENDRLLAINKPHNIPHHDDPSTDQLGILSLIRLQQNQQPNPSFSYPHRLYGVHRLDRAPPPGYYSSRRIPRPPAYC